MVFLDDAPAVHLLFEGGKLRTLERWDPATAWDTGFSTERCHAQDENPGIRRVERKGFDAIPKVRTCGLLNRDRDLV